MLAERIDLRNFKRAALAAPVLLFAAHFGCSTPNKQEPSITPTQTSGQQPNSIATQTPFMEQFDGDNQPTGSKTNTATRVPTFSTPSENPTPGIDKYGNLIIKDEGHNYTIFPNMTLDKLIGQNSINQPIGIDYLEFLNKYINPQATNDIRSILKAAQQKEQVNPQDPAIIKDVNSAANILNVHCNNNVYARIFMGYLASYLYLEKPQDWQNNKRIYLDGACFWGEKTVTSQDHEIIKIPLPSANDAPYYEPDGYFIYKGIGYDELVENLAKLKPVYTAPTFSRLTQYISEAKRLDAINPDSTEIMPNINEAGNIIRGSCERNKYSREYMRLLASLVYEKYPTTNDKYRLGFFELYIIDCEIYSKNL